MGASCTLDFLGGKLHSCGMIDREKYPSELAERFQLRLPPGLRDRIKAYAERHGRSMNTEIVRVLEREFPEPWSLESRIEDLIGLARILKGLPNNESIDQLVNEIYETLRGMITGRVKDVSEEGKNYISAELGEWELYQADKQQTEYTWDMDEEELESMKHYGKPEKF